MADAKFLVCAPQEPIESFNERLAAACKEAVVTRVEPHPLGPGFGIAIFAEEQIDPSEIEKGEPQPVDARHYVQVVAMKESEKILEFNARLLRECQVLEVTQAELFVVNGLPVILLMRQTEIKPAKPGGKDSDDDLISDPVQILVSRSGASTVEEAAKTEKYMDKIFEQAAGAVQDIMTDVGKTANGEDRPWAMVAFVPPPEESEDDDSPLKGRP